MMKRAVKLRKNRDSSPFARLIRSPSRKQQQKEYKVVVEESSSEPSPVPTTTIPTTEARKSESTSNIVTNKTKTGAENDANKKSTIVSGNNNGNTLTVPKKSLDDNRQTNKTQLESSSQQKSPILRHRLSGRIRDNRRRRFVQPSSGATVSPKSHQARHENTDIGNSDAVAPPEEPSSPVKFLPPSKEKMHAATTNITITTNTNNTNSSTEKNANAPSLAVSKTTFDQKEKTILSVSTVHSDEDYRNMKFPNHSSLPLESPLPPSTIQSPPLSPIGTGDVTLHSSSPPPNKHSQGGEHNHHLKTATNTLTKEADILLSPPTIMKKVTMDPTTTTTTFHSNHGQGTQQVVDPSWNSHSDLFGSFSKTSTTIKKEEPSSSIDNRTFFHDRKTTVETLENEVSEVECQLLSISDSLQNTKIAKDNEDDVIEQADGDSFDGMLGASGFHYSQKMDQNRMVDCSNTVSLNDSTPSYYYTKEFDSSNDEPESRNTTSTAFDQSSELPSFTGNTMSIPDNMISPSSFSTLSHENSPIKKHRADKKLCTQTQPVNSQKSVNTSAFSLQSWIGEDTTADNLEQNQIQPTPPLNQKEQQLINHGYVQGKSTIFERNNNAAVINHISSWEKFNVSSSHHHKTIEDVMPQSPSMSRTQPVMNETRGDNTYYGNKSLHSKASNQQEIFLPISTNSGFRPIVACLSPDRDEIELQNISNEEQDGPIVEAVVEEEKEESKQLPLWMKHRQKVLTKESPSRFQPVTDSTSQHSQNIENHEDINNYGATSLTSIRSESMSSSFEPFSSKSPRPNEQNQILSQASYEMVSQTSQSDMKLNMPSWIQHRREILFEQSVKKQTDPQHMNHQQTTSKSTSIVKEILITTEDSKAGVDNAKMNSGPIKYTNRTFLVSGDSSPSMYSQKISNEQLENTVDEEDFEEQTRISQHHDTVNGNEVCENPKQNIQKSDSVKNLINSFGGSHTQAKLTGIKAITTSSTTINGIHDSSCESEKVYRDDGQPCNNHHNEYLTDIKDENTFHKSSNVFGQSYNSDRIFKNYDGKNKHNKYAASTGNYESSASQNGHRKIEERPSDNSASKDNKHVLTAKIERTVQKDNIEDDTIKESGDRTESQHGKSDKDIPSSAKDVSSMRDLINAFGGTRLNPSPFRIRSTQTNLTMVEGSRKMDDSKNVFTESAIRNVEEAERIEQAKNAKPNDWKKTIDSEAQNYHKKTIKENFIDAEKSKSNNSDCPSSGIVHHRANKFGGTVPRNPSPFRYYSTQVIHGNNCSEKFEDKNGESRIARTSSSFRTSCSVTNVQGTGDKGVNKDIKDAGEKQAKGNVLGNDSNPSGTSVRDRINTFGGTRSNPSPIKRAPSPHLSNSLHNASDVQAGELSEDDKYGELMKKDVMSGRPGNDLKLSGVALCHRINTFGGSRSTPSPYRRVPLSNSNENIDHSNVTQVEEPFEKTHVEVVTENTSGRSDVSSKAYGTSLHDRISKFGGSRSRSETSPHSNQIIQNANSTQTEESFEDKNVESVKEKFPPRSDVNSISNRSSVRDRISTFGGTKSNPSPHRVVPSPQLSQNIDNRIPAQADEPSEGKKGEVMKENINGRSYVISKPYGASLQDRINNFGGTKSSLSPHLDQNISHGNAIQFGEPFEDNHGEVVTECTSGKRDVKSKPCGRTLHDRKNVFGYTRSREAPLLNSNETIDHGNVLRSEEHKENKVGKVVKENISQKSDVNSISNSTSVRDRINTFDGLRSNPSPYRGVPSPQLNQNIDYVSSAQADKPSEDKIGEVMEENTHGRSDTISNPYGESSQDRINTFGGNRSNSSPYMRAPSPYLNRDLDVNPVDNTDFSSSIKTDGMSLRHRINTFGGARATTNKVYRNANRLSNIDAATTTSKLDEVKFEGNSSQNVLTTHSTVVKSERKYAHDHLNSFGGVRSFPSLQRASSPAQIALSRNTKNESNITTNLTSQHANNQRNLESSEGFSEKMQGTHSPSNAFDVPSNQNHTIIYKPQNRVGTFTGRLNSFDDFEPIHPSQDHVQKNQLLSSTSQTRSNNKGTSTKTYYRQNDYNKQNQIAVRRLV